MIRLQIQSDVKEGALGIVQAAISAEVKRLEIGLHRLSGILKGLRRNIT